MAVLREAREEGPLDHTIQCGKCMIFRRLRRPVLGLTGPEALNLSVGLLTKSLRILVQNMPYNA